MPVEAAAPGVLTSTRSLQTSSYLWLKVKQVGVGAQFVRGLPEAVRDS